jgi:hypothetical protein
MTVRRDMLGHAPPTAQQYAQWAALSAEKPTTPAYIPIMTAALAKIPDEPESPGFVPPTLAPQELKPKYALSPLQQHDAMKREAWERERKNLLKKASNFGGESTERIISDYLVI